MELDELKKSWGELDKRLKKEELIDEQTLNKLITQHTTATNSRLKKIANWGFFSVSIGILVLVLGAILFFVLPTYITDPAIIKKIGIVDAFLGISIVFGLYWDTKTYLWIRNTKLEEMPTVTVIERINKFRSWTGYEIIALGIWMFLFMGLMYYVYDMYQWSALGQCITITFWIVVTPLIVYYIYKKMIYDNIKDIKKNLSELKDLKG